MVVMDIDELFGQLEDAKRPYVARKPWMDTVRMERVTSETLPQVIDACIASGLYALDLETTGLDTRVYNGRTMASIVGACISPDGESGYYIPVRHPDHMHACVPLSLFESEMRRLTRSPAVAIFHNGKFDHEFLQFSGSEEPMGEWDTPSQWEDTLILVYLRNTQIKDKRLKQLAKRELGMEMIELTELYTAEEHERGDGYNFSILDPMWEPTIWYAASDAICTYRLYKKVKDEAILPYDGQRVDNTLVRHPPGSGYVRVPSQKSLYDIEKLAVAATRWMERNRIPISRPVVAELIRMGQREWLPALQEVYAEASKVLGRDITPGYIRLLLDPTSPYRFDPEHVGHSGDVPGQDGEDTTLKGRIDSARLQAEKTNMDPHERHNGKDVIQRMSKIVPRVDKPEDTESIDFPIVYDIISPNQLGLLLRELGVAGLRLTAKSGQVQTSADELERVIAEAGDQFTFIPKIRRFREVAKALASNLQPIWDDTHPLRSPDSTLRVNFDAFKTDTGRYSTPAPKEGRGFQGTVRWNVLSIPASYDTSKPECMLRLREAIEAPEGSIVVAIDYSGQELRVATNFSGEPKWVDEFFRCSNCNHTFDRGGPAPPPPEPPPTFCPNCGSDKIGDLHTLTALSVFGDGIKEDPKEMKAKRQQAKCVHPDTLIQTPHGRIRIGDLPLGEEDTFFPITGVDVIAPGGQLVPVKETYNGGVKPLYHVVTRRGVLTCSGTHRFLLLDGSLVSVEDGLRVGMVLPEPTINMEAVRPYQSIPYPAVKSVPELYYQPDDNTAYFAGLHAGDGCSSAASAEITHGPIGEIDQLGVPFSDWQAIIVDACRAVGLNPQAKQRRVYLGSRMLLRWMQTLGLVKGTHRTLRVPKWVLSAGREAIGHYLGGLIDTDGYVSTGGELSITTKDFVFAGQVADLFRAMGCSTTVGTSWNETYQRYYLKVSVKRKDGALLLPYMRHPGKKVRVSETTGSYDRFPNEVTLILTAGNGPCMDLHVDSTDHLYVANGLTVHNSLNFAMCYGGGGQAAQRAVGCSKEEGWRIKSQFDKSYKGLAGWWRRQHEYARQTGVVLTAYNRRIHLPDILHPEGFIRSKLERNAINGPIQGSGADIIKLAMGLIYMECKKRNWLEKVKIIISIHDELVFVIHKDILNEALPVLKDIMLRRATSKLPWRVPLTCDVEAGPNWAVEWNLTKIEFGKAKMPPELAPYLQLRGAGAPVKAAPPQVEATPVVVAIPVEAPPVDTTHTPEEDMPASPLSPPMIKPGDPFIFKIPRQDLSFRTLTHMAKTIQRCSGRGPHTLQVVLTETGEPLWDGRVTVNPMEFIVLMNMPET